MSSRQRSSSGAAASQDDAWTLIKRLQEENAQLRSRCLNSPINSGRLTNLQAEVASRLDERESRTSRSVRLPNRPARPSPPPSPSTSADGEESLNDLHEFESRMCPPGWYQMQHELFGEGTIVPDEGSWKQKWDMLILVLILYSAVVVPYRVCFDDDPKGRFWIFEVRLAPVGGYGRRLLRNHFTFSVLCTARMHACMTHPRRLYSVVCVRNSSGLDVLRIPH